MECILIYAIGCLTGLLIGLMLLTMQAQNWKRETCEKPAAFTVSHEPEDSEEEAKLRKQFDNFLNYTGKNQDDNSI